MKDKQIRGGARRQPGTIWRNVPIPLELFKKVNETAIKAGRSTAYEIRLALEDWLKRNAPPQP